jgi:hypothetical protein
VKPRVQTPFPLKGKKKKKTKIKPRAYSSPDVRGKGKWSGII